MLSQVHQQQDHQMKSRFSLIFKCRCFACISSTFVGLWQFSYVYISYLPLFLLSVEFQQLIQKHTQDICPREFFAGLRFSSLFLLNLLLFQTNVSNIFQIKNGFAPIFRPDFRESNVQPIIRDSLKTNPYFHVNARHLRLKLTTGVYPLYCSQSPLIKA